MQNLSSSLNFFEIMPMTQSSAFTIKLILLFTLLFTICYGGSSLINTLFPRETFSPTLDFEQYLPIHGQWVWVYFSLPVALMVTIWRLGWYEKWRFFVVLCGELFSGCLIFLLFPMQLSFHAQATDAVRIAHIIGMTHNYLPSLHAAFAWTLALAWQHEKSTIRLLAWIYACAVVISTVAIQAHHIADAVSGCLLAGVWWRVLSRYDYQINIPKFLTSSIIKTRSTSR